MDRQLDELTDILFDRQSDGWTHRQSCEKSKILIGRQTAKLIDSQPDLWIEGQTDRLID